MVPVVISVNPLFLALADTVTSGPIIGMLIGGLLLIMSVGMAAIAVADSKRYMAVAPSMKWATPAYVRSLPDVLQMLREAAFDSPWPKGPNPLSILRFKWRLRLVLLTPYAEARELIEQHLSFWVYVQLHQQDLRRRLLIRKIRRLSSLLFSTPDDKLRSSIRLQMDQCRHELAMNARENPPAASTPESDRWLSHLVAMHAIFSEHEFVIDPALAELERWQDASDQDLLETVTSHQDTGTPYPT